MAWLTVVPAYGHDYETEEQAREAWESGQDFRVSDISAGRNDGRYVAKSDLPAGTTVKIRFAGLAEIAVIEP